jgi:putative membrane protein
MKNLKHIGWLATAAATLLWGAMSFAQSGAYPQTQPGAQGAGAPGTMGAPGQPGAAGYPGQPGYPGQAGTMGNPMGTNGTAGGQMQDHTFMMKAAEGGMAEVQMGQLAQQNGQSQEVKDFGQRMVTDHTKANDQLKQVAQQENVTLPTSPSSHDQAEYDKMSKLHGDAFDKAYSKMMVSDHKKDIAEFQREASAGSNPQVKNFADQTLPTLQEHLQLAEKMNKDEKSGGHSGSGNGSSSQ